MQQRQRQLRCTLLSFEFLRSHDRKVRDGAPGLWYLVEKRIDKQELRKKRRCGRRFVDPPVLLKHQIRRRIRQVRGRIGILSLGLLAFAVGAYGQSQSGTTPNSTTPHQAASQSTSQKQGRSAGGDIGSGSGDIGKGAGKGAGDLAKGTGKGAGDLVTLHPVDAAGEVGKGAASAGKNVGVGTAKGTGKIVKGTGKVLKKPF